MVAVLPRRAATLSIAPFTFLLGCLAVEGLYLLGGHPRQRGFVPSPKILGRNVTLRDLLQIGIDIRRRYVAQNAIFIDVLKQFLSRQFLAGPHYLGGPAILYPELPRLTALAFEMEFQLSPFHFDVVVLESSQPVALVVLGE